MDCRAEGAYWRDSGSAVTTIILATENRHKFAEITAILEGCQVLVNVRPLWHFPGVVLPPEVGASYAENAVIKARTVMEATGHIAIGDDTGLEIDALHGAPGLYSARFAGDGVTYADNRNKVLDQMRGVTKDRRGARFLCVVAIAFPGGRVEVVEGRVDGVISEVESGNGGFGYDPIFYMPETGKTFSEMSFVEKNTVSHRGRAVRAAVNVIFPS